MYGTVGTTSYPMFAGTASIGTLSAYYIPPVEQKIYSLLHLLLVKQRIFRKRIGGF